MGVTRLLVGRNDCLKRGHAVCIGVGQGHCVSRTVPSSWKRTRRKQADCPSPGLWDAVCLLRRLEDCPFLGKEPVLIRRTLALGSRTGLVWDKDFLYLYCVFGRVDTLIKVKQQSVCPANAAGE